MNKGALNQSRGVSVFILVYLCIWASKALKELVNIAIYSLFFFGLIRFGYSFGYSTGTVIFITYFGVALLANIADRCLCSRESGYVMPRSSRANSTLVISGMWILLFPALLTQILVGGEAIFSDGAYWFYMSISIILAIVNLPGVIFHIVSSFSRPRIYFRESYSAIICVCTKKCDCERYPTHISNECPIHNDEPSPNPECPIHGQTE